MDVKKIISVLSVCVMVILIYFSTTFKPGEPPMVVGHSLFVVTSGSMSPSFDTGALIVVRDKKYTTIKEGDVISFKMDNNSIATHRIIELTSDNSYITKGDANNVIDNTPVKYEDVVGKKVLAIPGVGKAMYFAREELKIVPISIILILLYTLYEVCSALFKKEDEESPEIEIENQ